MIHRHRYLDVGKDYVEGKDVGGARGYTTEHLNFLMKLASGYTVIHQRCDCGKYRTQEVLGKLD